MMRNNWKIIRLPTPFQRGKTPSRDYMPNLAKYERNFQSLKYYFLKSICRDGYACEIKKIYLNNFFEIFYFEIENRKFFNLLEKINDT